MHAMTMRPPSVKSSMNASAAAASTATAQQQQQPERHLLQNEANCKLYSASCIQTKAFVELPPQQLQQSQQQQQQHIKIPTKSREIIVENQYNFAESGPTKPSTSFQFHYEIDGRGVGGGIVASPHHEDSIQLLDLSTSPPTHDHTNDDDDHPLGFLQRNTSGRVFPRPPTQTSHGPNGGKSSSTRSSVLSSSSSEDEPAAAANRSSSSSSSAALYDDAAEHFIITYPAETPRYDTASEADNCLAGLPLSEKEPLLQSNERSQPEEQLLPQQQQQTSSLCLNKNSASLIFTRKDLSGSGAARYILPTPPPNNNSEVIAAPVVRRSYHQSLRAVGAERTTRKQTKHLPASYLQQQQQQQPKHTEKIHLQQRRSLQLNYNNNNNLVTSTTASATFVAGPAGLLGQTNNNNCCGLNAKKSAQIAPACHQSLKGAQQQQLHSGVTASPPITAATSRKQHAYSWYAPVYSALEEELEQDSRDSSPIHNLANTKKQQHSKHYQQQQQHRSTIIPTSGSRSLLDNQEPLGNTATTADNETVALLETRKHISIQGPLGKGDRIPHLRRPHSVSGGVQVQVPTSLPLHNGSGLSSGSDGGGGGCGSDGSSAGAGSTGHPADPMSEGSLGLAGSQLPPRRRLGNFLKSLVGGRKRNSSGSLGGSGHGINTAAPALSTTVPAAAAPPPIPSSPEITITRTPSEQNMGVLHDAFGRYPPKDYAQYHGDGKLTNGYRSGGSTSSLNVVHQKLINIMRREGSAASLHQEKSQSIVQYTNGMRKCETVLALTRQTQSLCSPVYGPIGPMLPGHGGPHLTHSSGSGVFNAHGVEQIRPLNRLRNSVTSMNATCSRCSSLLSLAASGSRYSLNIATGAYSLNTAYAAQRSSVAANRSSANVSTTANSGLCRSVSADEQNSYLQQPDQVDGHDLIESRKSLAGLSAMAIAPATASSTSISPPLPIPSNHHHPPQATLSLQQPTCPISAMTTSVNSSPTTITAPTPTATTSNSNLCSLLIPPVAAATIPATPTESPPDVVEKPFETFTCKLCLIDVETAGEATTLQQCGCQFCTECMRAYVEFEICEAAYEISCPDAQCPAQGIITPPEIATLTTANLMKKHHRYRLNREIDLDKTRTWCPRAGCETVCHVGPPLDITGPSTSSTTPVIMQQQQLIPSASDGITAPLLCAVQCPSCKDEFCSACKKTWHPNMTCEENGRRLTADGQDDIGIPFDNDLIKCCPMCAVPIEKDEGCAQMMCKRCKHVFCWYCLASLDDDFLLRHYDKGPCKNKLGHSRASVVWHRAQVIGIFAGFGILLLVASPLLLLAAPCIICCKCRSCSGSKIDDVDGELDEAAALQS